MDTKFFHSILYQKCWGPFFLGHPVFARMRAIGGRILLLLKEYQSFNNSNLIYRARDNNELWNSELSSLMETQHNN